MEAPYSVDSFGAVQSVLPYLQQLHQGCVGSVLLRLQSRQVDCHTWSRIPVTRLHAGSQTSAWLTLEAVAGSSMPSLGLP
jgi:hypothetical protein